MKVSSGAARISDVTAGPVCCDTWLEGEVSTSLLTKDLRWSSRGAKSSQSYHLRDTPTYTVSDSE
eukprot:2388382-Amphidinium_carterae.1